ncbi:MAG TPA: primosomal protein N' [Methylococcaceae bacterium]|nr:primosomal protein N' [Methylococcaceae bacterium]
MTRVLRIAVPAPVFRLFDYLPPPGASLDAIRAGSRVRVTFGRRKMTGYVVEVKASSEVSADRLRCVDTLLDEVPLLSERDLRFLHWASAYYQHPLGETLRLAFPPSLRDGKAAKDEPPKVFFLTELGCRLLAATSGRKSPRRDAVLAALAEAPDGLSLSHLRQQHGDPIRILRDLKARGWVETGAGAPQAASAMEKARLAPPLELNPDQLRAVEAVRNSLDHFGAFLLDGVTGSGKTEVYLQLAEQVWQRGGQTLFLLPEIALTPQLEARFAARLAEPVAVFHSGLNDTERTRAWVSAQRGAAAVLLGTRSALFAPMPHLGLIVVDEEHDASFKAQEGLRFSARDAAVMRAREWDVPIVLGSATPSLESLYNAQRGRYRHLRLPRRAGDARPPSLRLVDIRKRPLDSGLSPMLLEAMRQTLEAGGQILLFLNRRGYAPVLTCHPCGWIATCQRCDTPFVVHAREKRLHCHHCGAERPLPQRCPDCGEQDLRPLGLGTERVEQALTRLFPERNVVRIDRDTTRRKGSLQQALDGIHAGEAEILVGTQMLSKGHHFPNVTLAGVLDVDSGLYSIDFRAAERLAQLIVQVAGRAGRGEKSGQVLLQTRHPDHPLLQSLLREGYEGFARAALQERRAAGLPPFGHLALLRAEAVDDQTPCSFLVEAAGRLERMARPGLRLFGPAPAPLARLAGRQRWQLLLQAAERRVLQRALAELRSALDALESARRVRWSVDVDPLDMG